MSSGLSNSRCKALLAGILPSAPQQESVAQAETSAEGALELWGNLSLSDPWFLFLLPVALLALWLGRAKRRHASAHMSIVPTGMPRSIRQRLVWFPRFCEFVALVLTILALTRPLRGEMEYTHTSEGVDIVLLIDNSGSMDNEDLAPNKTRLDVVKEVVGAFAERRMTDREGNADNCCVVSFATYPELRCPFTLDVDAVIGSLQSIVRPEYRNLQATGIGLGLAKAVQVMKGSDSPSRIIVLLTDGEETVNIIAPLEAARLAADEGVRVYTVFAARYDISPLTGRLTDVEINVDTTDLKEIAEMTGGRFFRARDTKGLEDCYAAIEELERTEREETRYSQHYDLYLFLLLPAFIFYLLSLFSNFTWARRLP